MGLDIDKLLPPLIQVDEDIEASALDFVEQEVGRHDWRANWQVVRKDILPKLDRWLKWSGYRLKPESVAEYLDDLVRRHPEATWR